MDAREALARFTVRRQHERPPLMAAKRADPAFCRDAVHTGRDADRMHAALTAVLDKHQPRDQHDDQCAGCLEIDPGGFIPWPCPTAQIITTKLTEREA